MKVKNEATAPSTDDSSTGPKSMAQSPPQTPKGRKRIKPEPTSDDDFAPQPKQSPTKKGAHLDNGGARGALPAPFVPDPSIVAANDPRLMCAIMEKALSAIGGKEVSEVAAEFGVDSGKLVMNWRNTARKKAVLAMRKEFLGELS